MLPAVSNNAVDYHLTHDLIKKANANKKDDENYKKQKQNTRDDAEKLNAGESSRDNPTIINIADTNPDHNQILLVNDNQHRLSPHNFVITMNRHVLLKQDTLINCRLSSHILSDNEYDILIYVKDAHWPKVIGNKDFSFPSTPAIPPQLCLLIKNVDLRIDFDEFFNDIHTNYPHIKNIIRMKNKFQNDIKMVKVELTSSSARDELLDQKRIIVNYITYDIIEYLAPANVLYVPSAWHWVILNSNALKLKKHVVHVEIKLMI
ncbi:unnamed protein product [Rotaria socialis]|uniref:Uncharacterized protein n=2 Tax=Rotaria socialis TaxID=392032 RepID=A0A821AHZ8_9BILA|nr:unnamed protein product [Rotaria socialis]